MVRGGAKLGVDKAAKIPVKRLYSVWRAFRVTLLPNTIEVKGLEGGGWFEAGLNGV